MGEQTSTKTNINWFPGHMAKTRRMIAENLKDVDVVFELLDARIPQSSENPEIAGLTAGKPRLTLLSKTSLADPLVTENWKVYFHSVQRPCIFYDCRTGEGISEIAPAMRRLCADKLQKYKERGMKGRKLKAIKSVRQGRTARQIQHYRLILIPIRDKGKQGDGRDGFGNERDHNGCHDPEMRRTVYTRGFRITP